MERLQKVIANSGVASRRKAEELISNGRVKVDGKVVKEAKGRITDYLVDFVNEQYGLRGTCIRVIVG